jgi:hypothetical protein
MLAWFQLQPNVFCIFNILTTVSFCDICLFNSINYKKTALLPLRKRWINSNLHQANITLNISTNYVLQLAIEANCKRPNAYSLILRFTVSRIIIYCLLQKQYFKNTAVKRKTHPQVYTEIAGKMSAKIIGVNTGKEKRLLRKRLKL